MRGPEIPDFCIPSRISSVWLKHKQIQLVAEHIIVRFVVVARKRLLDGHLLEQGDRKNL